MGRTAVFVDAGYLFARGSDAISGQTQPRHRLLLDEKKAIAALTNFAEQRSGTPGCLLRIYWYDATSSQGPNADHIRLAETDDVKLRLGTLNSFGQQKGVDSLIIADLIELARNGAIDSAVLVSGDDDLRVGVQVAQTFGIRVHLLGISGNLGEAQSKLLVRESDTSSRWGGEAVAAFLALRDIATTVAHEPVATETKISQAASAAPSAQDTSAESSAAAGVLRATTDRFQDALQLSDLSDIQTVYEATHKIPYHYDRRLLASARTDLGRDLDVTETRLLRKIFVEHLVKRLTKPRS